MSLCSPFRRTVSAKDVTTRTSWPPLPWTRSASVHLYLCSHKISTSFAVWSCSPKHALSRDTVSSHVILFSGQPLAIRIAPSPSQASLAASSAKCERRSTRLHLSSCRLTRKWCWNCLRSFHCCFVLIICTMRRPLSGCSCMGCLCNCFITGWCCQCNRARTYSFA